MRIIILIALMFSSSIIYAAESADLQSEKALKSEIQLMFSESKDILKTIQDKPIRNYFSRVITFEKTEIQNLFQFNFPLKNRYFSTPLSIRKSFYEEYLKKSFIEKISYLKNQNYSSKIDKQIRQSIEFDTLSYQKEFLSDISKYFEKYMTSDVFQRGNMHMTYNGSGGYVRVSMSEYDTTNSLARSEQSTNMKISVDMDMIFPGRTSCDYDDEWKRVCTNETGVHVVGDGSMKVSVSLLGNRYYVQLHDFTIHPKMSGTGAEVLQKTIESIRKYSDGKVYTYSVPYPEISGKDVLKNISETLSVLTSESILTPKYRIGSEYILDLNPNFTKKLRKIYPEIHIPTEVVYPSLRYSQGKYSFDYSDSSLAIFQYTLRRDPEKGAIFGAHIRTYGKDDSFSAQISRNSWEILLDLATEDLHMKSIWDGHTTDTTIIGTGVTAFLDGFYSSFGMYQAVDTNTANISKKIQISGPLSSANTSLSLTIDGVSKGLLRYFHSGNFTEYLTWFEYEKNRFEVSGTAEEKFGSFPIEKPKNAIELEPYLRRNLEDQVDALIP